MSNRRKVRGRDWAPVSRRIRLLAESCPQVLKAIAEEGAPGLADQLQAATADATRLNEQFRRRLREYKPGSTREADASRVSGEMRDRVCGLYIRVITELAAGKRRHCDHISMRAPRPCIAAVYADWIYCADCAWRITRPQLSEREEHTCDLCGSYRPGQPMDALYPQVGHVTLLIGVCPDCKTELEMAS